MSEARDMLLAGATISEAEHNLRRTIAELAEERRQLDWTIQRLREERLALEALKENQ